jgi:meckelin
VWNKRSGKLTLDAVTIGKFIMYLFSSIANVFFVVFIGACIWWLIFFKGQNLAYILLPVSTQKDSFTALLVIAFVFKAVDILYLILVQVSYDVFVIDWEKPKVETGKFKESFNKIFIFYNYYNRIKRFCIMLAYFICC